MRRCHAATSMSQLDIDRRDELAGEVDVQPAPLVTRRLLLRSGRRPRAGARARARNAVRSADADPAVTSNPSPAADRERLRWQPVSDGRGDTAAARRPEHGGIVGEQAPLAPRGGGPRRAGGIVSGARRQRRRRGPSDPDRVGDRRRADVHRPRRTVGKDHEGAGRTVVGVTGPVRAHAAGRRPRPHPVRASNPAGGASSR